MEHRLILSSGEKNPSDFTIRFDKPLEFDQNKTYLIGLASVDSMTYSWYNISEDYDNTTIRYFNGSEWKDIIFSNGAYSYEDINGYIREQLILNDDYDGVSGDIPIDLEFDITSFKVVVKLQTGYKLDLTGSNFHKLLGFESKIVEQSEYGSMSSRQ